MCDEAIHALRAANLVDGHGFIDGVLFPTHFDNHGFPNLLVSVYSQIPSYILFGRSILGVRGTTVVITLLGALALSGILRDSFKSKYWWAAILILGGMPSWFLHSRTNFEAFQAAPFYALMLFYYTRYRDLNANNIYASLSFGLLAGFTYSPYIPVIMITLSLLLVSDFKSHCKHWQKVIPAIATSGLVAFLINFRLNLSQSGTRVGRLKTLNSYLVRDLPISEKIHRFSAEYLVGLSPNYWANDRVPIFERHILPGYPHMQMISYLLCLLGLLLCIVRIRNSNSRLLLIAAIASPTGGAMVETGITRNSSFMLVATLGIVLSLTTIFSFIVKITKVPVAILQSALFCFLASVNILLAAKSVSEFSHAHKDYGLFGVQFGAKQIVERIVEYRRENPSVKIAISPDWGNSTETSISYLLKNLDGIRFERVEEYTRKLTDPGERLFFMLPNEFKLANESGIFKPMANPKTIILPNGNIGFYISMISYVEDANDRILSLNGDRGTLKQETVLVGGKSFQIKHSKISADGLENIFDKNSLSHIRGEEANPFIMEIFAPSLLGAVTMRFFVNDFSGKVRVSGKDRRSMKSLAVEKPFSKEEAKGFIAIELPAIDFESFFRIEITDSELGEFANVHLYELEFK